MKVALARNWWSLVIRGFLGILIGILTFVWPGVTLTALVFLFVSFSRNFGSRDSLNVFVRWGLML